MRGGAAKRWLAALALPVACGWAGTARAQVTGELTLQPRIPQGFSRGRNVSVAEQPQRDYAPIGMRLGGLTLNAGVETGVGATSNTYLSATDRVGSAFLYVEPSARLRTNWARDFLELSARATRRDYLGQSRRDEDLWSVGARGQKQLGRLLMIDAEASASRNFENPVSGSVSAAIAALSRYRRDFGQLRVTYTNGRVRTFAQVDYGAYRFNPLPLTNGTRRSQRDRDRDILRLTGQVEYARSPSVSFFGQVGYSRSDFVRTTIGGGANGLPNLDSTGLRVLAGTNVDMAGRARGTVALGYSINDYRSERFGSVNGLSFESQLELFPLQRLTMTVTADRTLEQSALSTTRNPFWNTEVALRADYSVMRNLTLNAGASTSRRSFIATSLRSKSSRAVAGAEYLISRRIRLHGGASISRRSSNNQLLDTNVREARVEAGLLFRI